MRICVCDKRQIDGGLKYNNIFFPRDTKIKNQTKMTSKYDIVVLGASGTCILLRQAEVIVTN